ncbi:hypothetical protein Tco_1262915 [Tanacetum coccineum]
MPTLILITQRVVDGFDCLLNWRFNYEHHHQILHSKQPPILRILIFAKALVTGVSDTVSTSMHNMGVCEVRPLGGRRTCVGTTGSLVLLLPRLLCYFCGRCGVYMTCWYLRWLFAQRMASEIADAGFGFIYICPWYGDLQGLNKQETAEIFCNEQVYNWRRSYTEKLHSSAA